MVTLSRNTQGGLGHRLRGRRGGNARHRHQLSSSGGGSRTGEMERREKKKKGANWVGRGFSLVTPQSSRARRMRRAEQETTREKNGNTAARVGFHLVLKSVLKPIILTLLAKVLSSLCPVLHCESTSCTSLRNHRPQGCSKASRHTRHWFKNSH